MTEDRTDRPATGGDIASQSGQDSLSAVRLLAESDIFGALPRPIYEAIAGKMRSIAVAGGTRLFERGDIGDGLYIVGSGCLGVFNVEGDAPALIAEVGTGEIVGEMALLGHRQRLFTVTALRDCGLWRLDRVDFEQLLSLFPQILPRLTEKIIERTAPAGQFQSRQKPRTFALVPLGHSASVGRFAVNLANALSSLDGFVQVLTAETMGRPSEWYANCERQFAGVLY